MKHGRRDVSPTPLRESANRASVFLRWTATYVKFRWPLELQLSDRCFSFARALFGLFVKLPRLRSGTAQARNIFNQDRPFRWPAADRQFIAGADDAAGFAAIAVHNDFTACHGVRRLRTSFEKTRGPEPFVEPNIAVAVFVVNQSTAAVAYYGQLKVGKELFCNNL